MAEEDIEYEENYNHNSHNENHQHLINSSQDSDEYISSENSSSQSKFSQMTIYLEKDSNAEDDEE